MELRRDHLSLDKVSLCNERILSLIWVGLTDAGSGGKDRTNCRWEKELPVFAGNYHKSLFVFLESVPADAIDFGRDFLLLPSSLLRKVLQNGITFAGKKQGMQVDIMAIAAHPDDVELSCSGTLLRHIDQGRTVGLVDLTRGELGTRGSAEIRDREAAEASRLMGAAFRENLRLPDGFFHHSEKTIRTIIQSLRTHRPRIVLINAPSDRHPDHGRAAQICRDACFFSGLLKIKTWDPNGKEQEKWRPEAVYHFIQDHNLVPDFVVDISDYIDRKMELVQAFRSQFFVEGDPQYAQEQATPISGQDFYEFLKAKARTYGRPAGFEYGEGFICARTPGVEDLFHLR